MGDVEEYFSCPACDSTFVTQRSLTIHMIFHEKDKKYPCTECTQVFYKETSLKEHVVGLHGPKKVPDEEGLPCEICGEHLLDRDLLFQHYKTLHPDLVKFEEDGEEEEYENSQKLTQSIKEEQSRKRKHFPEPTPEIKIKIPLSVAAMESDEDDEFEDGDEEDDIKFNPQLNNSLNDNVKKEGFEGRDMAKPFSQLGNTKEIPTFPQGLGYHFLQPETIANELNGSRTVKKLQCTECSASFTNTFNLERHKESHRSNRPHKCHLCPDNRGFLRKEHLTKHMSSVHSGMKFTCEFCGKDISRKDHLVRHIRNVHTAEIMGISGFTNPEPPANNPSPSPISVALANTIIGSTSISLSDDISITAVPVAEPTNARQSHSGSGNTSTSSLSLSDKALLSLQPKPKKPYVTCDMCTNLQFIDINELYEHQRLVHSDVRKFLCDFCPKSFKRREHLNKHIVLHTGEKNFSCTTCNKDFPRKDALMDHIRRIHAGLNGNEISPQVAMQQLLQPQAQFKCDLCEKSFLQKHSLVRHMKTVHSVISQYLNGTVIGGASAGNYDSMDMEFGYYENDSQEEDFGNNNELMKYQPPPPLFSITPNSTKKSIYPCPHCSATFNDENRFSLHLNIHKVV